MNTPLLENGGTTFSINKYYGTASHKPFSTNNGTVLTWTSSANYGAQIAFGTPGTYFRSNIEGVISGWFALTPEITALKETTNIFDFLSTSYPPGIYCGVASKLTNGNSTLEALLGVGSSAIIKIEKYDDWDISITITNQASRFCWATCNKNATSIAFAIIHVSGTNIDVNQITITKATS